MTARTDYFRISESNHEVFNNLMNDYYRPVIIFTMNIVKDMKAAEDIAQEVFVNIWVNRKKIDFGSSFKNYIYVTARNFSYNYLRDTRRNEEKLRLKNRYIPDELIESFIFEEETHRILQNAIEKLPPRAAQVIRLSLQGLKREEIACIMQVSESNVKNLKTAGIKKLREILDPLYFFIVATLIG